MATAKVPSIFQTVQPRKYFFFGRILLPFPILPLCEAKQENLLSTTSSSIHPTRLFFPSLCRAALSVCCSFYCVLERHDSGSTNICLFRRSVFLKYTHKKPSRRHRNSHANRENGSDDPCGAVCACVYRLFFSKNFVLLEIRFRCLWALYFSEIIYISTSFSCLIDDDGAHAIWREFQFACCKGFSQRIPWQFW